MHHVTSGPAAATASQECPANGVIAAWKTIMDFHPMDAKHVIAMLLVPAVYNVMSTLERATVVLTSAVNTVTDARKTSTTSLLDVLTAQSATTLSKSK
jgi:hypothetical protein